MNRSFSDMSRVSEESGSTIVEAAAVLPFLIMMVFATCDLGAALNQYLALNRVVYEGTRYAASLPGLEQGEFSAISGTAQNQNLVRDRVLELLTKNGFDVGTFSSVVTTNDNNVVSVRVEKPFMSNFGFFNAMPIRVNATGPYLSLNPDDVPSGD